MPATWAWTGRSDGHGRNQAFAGPAPGATASRRPRRSAVAARSTAAARPGSPARRRYNRPRLSVVSTARTTTGSGSLTRRPRRRPRTRARATIATERMTRAEPVNAGHTSAGPRLRRARDPGLRGGTRPGAGTSRARAHRGGAGVVVLGDVLVAPRGPEPDQDDVLVLSVPPSSTMPEP